MAEAIQKITAETQPAQVQWLNNRATITTARKILGVGGHHGQLPFPTGGRCLHHFNDPFLRRVTLIVCDTGEIFKVSVRSLWILGGNLILVTLLVLQAPLVSASTFPRARLPKKPFWERKERIYKKMVDERAIYVSVKTVDNKAPAPKPRRLKILGAGVIHRPRSVTREKLVQYDKWSGIHESIRVSTWTPATKRLFLHMEAFDYHAKMILQVEAEKRGK